MIGNMFTILSTVFLRKTTLSKFRGIPKDQGIVIEDLKKWFKKACNLQFNCNPADPGCPSGSIETKDLIKIISDVRDF